MAVFVLEDFDDVSLTSLGAPGLGDVNVEEIRLQAYESGYTAGWEDAVKAQSTDKERVSAAFERNLQELSFTYHEARNGVLQGFEPLLREMVSKVLPALGQAQFAETVVAAIKKIAEEQVNTPIEVVLCSENREAIEAMLSPEPTLPIEIVEESSLGEGQVYLRFGTSEQKIDLSQIQTQLLSSVDGFFERKAG
ncbi:FliH/SctL family protein [Cochlodiniinecator piscidefendens]|uniref:flagellar biosynthesis protein n=1 Tax=Cochlodiniinecator piscidefendens TaxID=2715756 RepID=UPI00140C483B|nr:flagellar biosynthesis protein [Cochlodiniinecator piscidefendens]